MDIEFHYYITGILAKEAGFDTATARKIAYASQYTDHNNVELKINCDEDDPYENYISQTMNIFKPKNRLVRIYSCFHFLPGDYASDSARRHDGVMHLFNTTPNSHTGKAVFEAALETGDLCRIGIATHSYADTWAHQNFVGYKHTFCAMKGLLENAIPDIGHADAQHNPDIPNLLWKDSRLIPELSVINNKERFLAAAEAIFAGFCKVNGQEDVAGKWADLRGRLDVAIGAECDNVLKCQKGMQSRITSYQAMLPENMREYDRTEWLFEAVEKSLEAKILGKWYVPKDGHRFKARECFQQSDWLGFQKAVQEHQAHVRGLLQSRYDQLNFTEQECF